MKTDFEHKVTEKATCCTCGHQWIKGKNGQHSCSERLLKQLEAVMKERIKLGVFGILEREGKVLLGLRDPGDKAFPNCWCHPGGGVEFQEPIDEALKREFQEEVLMDVEVLPHYMGVHEYIKDGRHVVLVFREVKAKAMPLVGDGFVGLGWFSIEEIRAMAARGETTPPTLAAAESRHRRGVNEEGRKAGTEF